jgi:hypothetical protein
MNIKEMLNQVLLQSGFLKKSSFTNNPDLDDEQMIAIANRAASEIVDFYLWGELRKEFTIQPTTGTLKYNMPNDFSHFIPESVWEEGGNKRVEIPVPDGRWYLYKFSAYSDGGVIRAKMYGKVMEINDPKTGDVINLEYKSNSAVLDSESQQTKQYFDDDNDTWLLDDQVLVLGIQAHWQQAKLMPSYQEHMANYMAKLNASIGRSAGSRKIGGRPFSTRRDPYYPLYQD